MPKAVSNLDTAFIEDITAMASRQRELCALLAQLADSPELLHLIRDVHLEANKIRRAAIEQREYLREQRQC